LEAKMSYKCPVCGCDDQWRTCDLTEDGLYISPHPQDEMIEYLLISVRSISYKSKKEEEKCMISDREYGLGDFCLNCETVFS